MARKRRSGKEPAARSNQPEPTRDRARRWWNPRLAAFLAGVFTIKLIVMSQLEGHPLLQPDAGLDTTTYVELARRVLGGDVTLGPGLYYMSPLYIYFLAAALWIRDSFTFVRALQAALGTAAVACVFVSAKVWFGERAAWIAAALAALTGVLTFYEVLILQSSLDSVLTAAALACLARALVPDDGAQSPGASGFSRTALGAGVLFGLQGLNRPNVLLAVAGVIVMLAVVRRLRIAVWVLAGLVAALAPVVVRNAAVSGEWALVSSQGGLNFYIGNHAGATGQYEAVPGVRANIEGQSEDTKRVAEAALGRSLGDADVSAYFTGLALTWMREHPAAAAKLFVRKLALVFNAAHQWLDFSYPYYAYDAGTILGLLAVGPWLLVPLGAVGLVLPFFDASHVARSSFLAWVSFVPGYAIAVAIFFVAERYRLPILVPLCVLAGAAADRALAAAALKQSRELAVAAGVFAVAAVAAGWPFHLNTGRFDERLRLAKVLMNHGEFGRAAAELQQALAIDPGHSVAEFNLGMALVNDRRATEGIPHIRHAIDAGVPVKGARYALARAMQAAGDTTGAAALLRTFQPEAPDDADSCVQVGMLALDAGAPDVAARYFRAALDRGARSASTYANLALSEARLGHPDEARRLAQTALQLDPSLDLKPLFALIGR